MNNTIPFHSATHAPQITVDVNILTMLKQAASCLTEMASENVYLAAIGPGMELTIIVEEDAPSILPCFDEDDALISVKGAPLFIWSRTLAPSRAVSALWSWCRTTTANCYSPNLIVAPVTSNTVKKPDHQAHVLVDGNRAFLQPSMILAKSVQTISKGRLIRPMGRLSIPELIRLNYALLYQLDLNEWVWRKEAYERYLRYHR